MKASTEALRAELLARYKAPRRLRLSSPQAVYEHLHPLMVGLEREEFHVICLDSRNNVLAHERVAVGSADQCAVDPREVFRPAILCRASAMILAHNHPTGDTEPSQQDVTLTHQLREGARLLCVTMLDHLVIGASGFVSLEARGLMRGRPGAISRSFEVSP